MRNSQGLQQKCRRLQVVENKKHRLVGAPRFELGTSCAQEGRANEAPQSLHGNNHGLADQRYRI